MAKDLVRTRRYVQKFYQMRTQLQAVGLRIQTLRSNQQMADAMLGATRVRCSQSTYAIRGLCYLLCYTADYDGIREAERDDGHEGGNDGGRGRRCHGGRRGR